MALVDGIDKIRQINADSQDADRIAARSENRCVDPNVRYPKVLIEVDVPIVPICLVHRHLVPIHFGIVGIDSVNILAVQKELLVCIFYPKNRGRRKHLAVAVDFLESDLGCLEITWVEKVLLDDRGRGHLENDIDVAVDLHLHFVPLKLKKTHQFVGLVAPNDMLHGKKKSNAAHNKDKEKQNGRKRNEVKRISLAAL